MGFRDAGGMVCSQVYRVLCRLEFRGWVIESQTSMFSVQSLGFGIEGLELRIRELRHHRWGLVNTLVLSGLEAQLEQ